MERRRNAAEIVCKICGEAFMLPEEDEVDGKLPRTLLCSHVFCTCCLLSMENTGVIQCPVCEVDSVLPEGGVLGLLEDSGIIGLLYMSKISKMRIEKRHISGSSTPSDVNGNSEIMEQPNRYKKTMEVVEEALAKAVEKHDQLMKEHEMLKVGLDKQIRRENVRLSTEINLVVAKAVKAVHKWGDTQHNHLSNLEALFSKSQNQVDLVEEKIKFLENAMDKAVQLRHPSSLELNGDFKKVLETLETALEPHSFNVECISLDSGISLPESPCQQCEIIGKKCPWQVEDGLNKMKSSEGLCPSKGGPLSTQSASSSSPKSHQGMERLNVSIHGSTVDLLNPDVIIEEISEEIKNPFTSPPIQTKKKGTSKKGNKRSSDSRKVLQWVSVTHVVSPSLFYIRHLTETKEQVKLSTRINSICKETNCSFSSADTLERGSYIFFKWEEKWCRAIVMELFDSYHSGVVEACPISECTVMKVFLLDYGPTVSVKPNSDDGNEWTLMEISNQIKMVGDEVKFELSSFEPQAVRCCLKNIVPKNQTLGWCSEAQQTFLNLVSGSVVQMEALGQDGESLLVDLKKTMVDQSANGPMSLREYLVFSDLARFDSLLSGRRQGFYPPINPRINQEYNAVVSHINNPDDFHIQLVDNMEYLMLSANLQDCYNTASIAEDESLPVIGQACVARYEDNLWYRAQVIGHPEAAKVNIKYVDFGNTKIISVCNLRKIKGEFSSLPSMAIHCCLSDIVPLEGKTWSEACTNRFISLAHQKLVTLVITEKVSNNGPHPVKLFESDVNSLQSNVADTLVKEDLAFLREGNHFESSMTENAVWDSPLDLSTPKSIEVVEKNVEDQDKKKSALVPSLMFPQQLGDIKVRVSHVFSPSRFYVQIAEYAQQLKSLSDLLRREYMLTEPSNIEWKKDMFCAAYINGIWDRVQILSDAPSSGMEEVIRCDYGNETKVNIDQLRLLPSSLNGSFALECTLTDIRPAGGGASWTATACDFLSRLLSGSSALMTIKEATDKRPVPVTLSRFNHSGQFVRISDVLTSEGLALRDKKPPSRECLVQVPNDDKVPVKIPANGVDSNTTDFPTPAIFTSRPTATPRAAPRLKVTTEKVETGLYQPPKLPPTGHTQAVICAIDEDGVLYARTKNMEYDLCILRERIRQNIRSPPRPNMYTWRSVKGCTVFGPDMVWYRAQVLEVLGGHLKVQYVDYGLVENIPMVHAHPLLLCVDVPQLCVPCQLRDVNPLHVIGVLKEMLQNRPVDMNVLELPADPRAPVLIEIFLDGQKLSKIMFYHKNTSMCTSLSVSPPLGDWSIEVENLKVQSKQTLEVFIGPDPLPVNTCFKVAIRHLLTPNELYLCPTEGVKEHRVAGETLEEALSRINEIIDALPRVTCITAEAQCLAEYIDGKYYRAKVLRLVSVEPVLVMVQHVDFGSDDTLPLSKLRQMPAELLQFPVQVVKVYVASLKPPSVQQEGEVLPYSPQWGMKAVTTMIQLLHSNISATVVTPRPQLTVELTNHQGELVHLPLLSCGLAELD